MAAAVTDGVVGLGVAGIFGWFLWKLTPGWVGAWNVVGLYVGAGFAIAAGLGTAAARAWSRPLVLGPLAILVLSLLAAAGPDMHGTVLFAVLGGLAYLARVLVHQPSWLHRVGAIGAAYLSLLATIIPITWTFWAKPAWVVALVWLVVVASAVLLARARALGILVGCLAIVLVGWAMGGNAGAAADVVGALIFVPMLVPVVRYVWRRD